MREAGCAAGDVRTVGSVERLVDEEAWGGQQSRRWGTVQPVVGQRREKPDWMGSPQNEHVGRKGKDWKRIGEWRRGVGGGIALGVEEVMTAALVSVREPRRRVKK